MHALNATGGKRVDWHRAVVVVGRAACLGPGRLGARLEGTGSNAGELRR